MSVEQKAPRGDPARGSDAAGPLEPDVRTLFAKIREDDAESRWSYYWFGSQASAARRASGFALAAPAAAGLGAPLLQWWASHKLDWYLLLLPSVVALVLLALPNTKSITIEAGKLKLSAEPLPATGREAAPVTTPESFNVPMLGTVAVTAIEANQSAKA